MEKKLASSKTHQPKTVLPVKFLRQSAGALILLCLCIAAHAQSTGAPAAKENGGTAENKNYKIGAGDILKVVVTKQPLLSLDSVRVSQEGTIRLPMLEGEVPAVCLTEAELSGVITEKYKKYLLNPQVYVAVQEFNSNPVAVLGAVNSPGRFDIQRPTRLLELLTLTNGPSAKAGKDIRLFRTSSGERCRSNPAANGETEKNQEELIVLPLEAVMRGAETANLYVQAGDVITVAEADKPGEAYIIGNVVSAKAITLSEPTTLTKALAMAGGVTKEGKIDKIKITRQDPTGLNKTVIVANMKEIEKDRQKDVLLQSNDIVEVPGPAGAEKLLRGIYKSIVPTITRGIIPVY